MKRRTFITGAGGIAIGSLAVTGLSGRSKAQSDVDTGDFRIADRQEKTTDQINDVILDIDVTYDYESNVNPDRWEIVGYVGTSPDSMYPIDSIEATEELLQSSSGEETLSGSIVDTPAFAIQTFNVTEGDSMSVNGLGRVTFDLFHDSEAIAQAQVEDSFSVSIENGSLEASASIGGDGSISLE